VVAADVHLPAAERAVALIESNGGKALAWHVDLAEEASIVALVRAAVDTFGSVDILHNNAADLSPQITQLDNDVESMTADVWDRVFRVNVRGTMLACKYVLPHMVARGAGSIINTASNLGLQGNLGQAAYAASKAAVMQLTRSIATSHARRGIRCNTVSPGLVMTPAARDNLPPQLHKIVAGETLTPYLGVPEDIAHAVVYLASDEARYVTGHNLVVDGGTSATCRALHNLPNSLAGTHDRDTARTRVIARHYAVAAHHHGSHGNFGADTGGASAVGEIP
jgi:NAD(P)-dependent dehydrogenase (short-subunit alcohol dehydrogenase family)